MTRASQSPSSEPNSGRVLIVEDQALVALELQERLRERGFVALGPAATADEAISLAREQLPDLVLMDISLARGGDGVAAAVSIREELDVAIVFLTAYADDETVARSQAVEPDGYLIKPFDDRLLEITIDHAIHRRRSALDRARVERDNRKLEARLAAVLRYSRDGIIMAGADRRIVFYNAGAQSIFGWRTDEILGEPVERLVPEELGGRHAMHYRRFAETASGGLSMLHRREVVGRRRSGETFPAELTLSRTVVDDEVLLAAFVRDISERRALEEKYVLAEKLEAVGRLAAGIVHDFNTVLSTIALNTRVVRELPEGDEESWAAIDKAIARGTSLVQRLIGVARHGGVGPSPPEPYDAGEVVVAIAPLLRRMIHRDVAVEVTGTSERLPVRGDAGRLEQAIVNLVANALEASPERGRVLVTAQSRRLAAPQPAYRAVATPGAYAALSVIDEGPGMSEETLARAFEPFFTTKAQRGGTGLGLPTVLDVANEHGGFLIVSTSGAGTRFELLIPLYDEDAADESGV